MKRTINFFYILIIFSFALASKQSIAQSATTKTESFKVYGNCEMCKDRIEGVLKRKEGVLKKNWNDESKILTVTFEPEKITLIQIKQKIADEGYDTDEIHAKDTAYNSLSKCCQYKRAKSSN